MALEYNYSIDELKEISFILGGISDNMFSSPNVSLGRRGVYFLSGESITAVENTIKTIDFCCDRGFFSDAFTLARKYRDDIFQYLFVSYIIENMHGLSKSELERIFETGISDRSLIEALEMEMAMLSEGKRKTGSEKAIELWMYDNLDEKRYHKERKEYYDASKYKEFFSKDEIVGELYNTYLKDMWDEINSVLNNYVHANGRKYVICNYSCMCDQEKLKEELLNVVQKITTMFLAILAIIEPAKMESSDYRDAIENGEEPKNGSQYWVMPVVIEYMDKYFSRELIRYLDENNDYGMKFLLEYYV